MISLDVARVFVFGGGRLISIVAVHLKLFPFHIKNGQSQNATGGPKWVNGSKPIVQGHLGHLKKSITVTL